MRIFFLISFFLLIHVQSESSISLLSKIGAKLDSIENKLVKGLLETRVEKAWALDREDAKIAALAVILKELSHNQERPVKLKPDSQLEIELCNYLLQQACILEALDGAGV